MMSPRPALTALGVALVAALPSASLAQNAARGSTIYAQICSACHTANPRNDPNRGFTGNGGVRLGAGAPQTILNAIEFRVAQMAFLASVLTLPGDAQDVAAWLATVFGTTPAPASLQMPSPLDFGNQAVGTSSAPQAATIVNTGGAPATVTAVTSSSSEFSVVSETCTSAPVAGGANCLATIAFHPAATGPRSGSITLAGNGNPQSFAVAGSGVDNGGQPLPAGMALTVEYFHAGFGHYFVTAEPAEVKALDDGTVSGWVRTGRSFKVWTGPAPARTPVCRFFTVAFAPKSSHFYTSSAPECDGLKSSPDWIFEAQVFFVQPPAGDGSCPAGTQPVYRVYNNGLSGAPNHRYTVDPDVRAAMLAAGYSPEGVGIGTGFCVPQ